MAHVLTITPNPLLDLLSPVAVRTGHIVRAPAFTPIAGGKGLNVARILVRLGHQATACGFVGGGTGGMLTSIVAADGVETAFTDTAARLRLGFQAPGPEGTTSLLETGFTVTPAEVDRLIDTIAERAPSADLVVVGGSVPDPATCDGLLVAILTVCAAAGTPCWVDSYGPAMDRALASDQPPALAKPNAEEQARGGDWHRCGELHVSNGPAAVCVRRGTERWRVVPPQVDEANPVGSGDSYVAGLAHARLMGEPFARQLAWAAAAGAANAARSDVAEIGPEDIVPLLDQVTVEAGPGEDFPATDEA